MGEREEKFKKIDKILEEKFGKEDLSIFQPSIIKVKDKQEDTLGKDLQEITKELTNDENVLRFSNSQRNLIGYDSLLGAIGDYDLYKDDKEPRYTFIQRFRYHYAINRSALKSGQAERYKDLAGSLLGFKALLEYRHAGVRDPLLDEKKHSMVDKLKKV